MREIQVLNDGDESYHLGKDIAAIAIECLLLCLWTLPTQSLQEVYVGFCSHLFMFFCLYIRQDIAKHCSDGKKKSEKKYGAQPMLRIVQFCLQATTPMVEGSR